MPEHDRRYPISPELMRNGIVRENVKPRAMVKTGAGGVFRRLFLHGEFRLSRVRDQLIVALQSEVDSGLLFNLTPVFLAIGIGLYFLAPVEPMFSVVLVLFAMMAGLAFMAKTYGQGFLIAAAFAAVFAGMASAQISTILKSTPIIERQFTGSMTGLIVSVDQNRRGSPRMLIKPIKLEKTSSRQLPERIRVSAAKGAADFMPGDIISGLVRLHPVSGPAYPGSYNFSFHAWYAGIGGSGFFMGAPARQNIDHNTDIVSRMEIMINRLRLAIAYRVRAVLPGSSGGIAVALITGDRSGIDAQSADLLRKTGLAHILAISGLHMALVTLTVIWLIRLGFTLAPNLSLSFPIKKWAVCVGFFCATGYLFLSGAGIATQRAWIMISVMLLAVLMDRRAITMRSVAFSACLVLLTNPESLWSPGFQMSFAAVAALVAGYEIISRRKADREQTSFYFKERSLFARVMAGLLRYISGLAVTSVIAGTATAFITAWHFNQVASLGLVANILAMPIVAVFIMPLVMACVLLMPFGFEVVALQLVSVGIDTVLFLAGAVLEYSPSGIVGQGRFLLLPVFGLLLAGLTLFRTRLRLLSIAGFAIVLLLWKEPDIPDLLISENGRAVGIIENDVLVLVYPRRNRFITDIWAKAWTGNKTTKQILDPEQCTRERCVVVLGNGKILHLVYAPEKIPSSCLEADLLIAARLWWVRCSGRNPELVLTRQDFEANGAHAIHFETAQNGNRFMRINSALSGKTFTTDRSSWKPQPDRPAPSMAIRHLQPMHVRRPWTRNISSIDDYFQKYRSRKTD